MRRPAAALGALAALATRLAAGEGIRIDHTPAACVVAGRLPKLGACFEPPDAVARALVYVQAGTSGWRPVEMHGEDGCFSAVLPKPQGSTIRYFIRALDFSLAPSDSSTYWATVATDPESCGTSFVSDDSVAAEWRGGAPGGVAASSTLRTAALVIGGGTAIAGALVSHDGGGASAATRAQLSTPSAPTTLPGTASPTTSTTTLRPQPAPPTTTSTTTLRPAPTTTLPPPTTTTTTPTTTTSTTTTLITLPPTTLPGVHSAPVSPDPESGDTSVRWRSHLSVPDSDGQLVLNGRRIWYMRSGHSEGFLADRRAEQRLEALLVRASGRAGTWRFDLPKAVVPRGSLRVIAGAVAAVTASSVTFRLSGRPGERLVFAFRTDGTEPGRRKP